MVRSTRDRTDDRWRRQTISPSLPAILDAPFWATTLLFSVERAGAQRQIRRRVTPGQRQRPQESPQRRFLRSDQERGKDMQL
jgi:hypothetical protein